MRAVFFNLWFTNVEQGILFFVISEPPYLILLSKVYIINNKINGSREITNRTRTLYLFCLFGESELNSSKYKRCLFVLKYCRLIRINNNITNNTNIIRKGISFIPISYFPPFKSSKRINVIKTNVTIIEKEITLTV
jgi:hypothetical protein